MLKRIVIGLALTAVIVVPASALAAVQLTIRDGRVWLAADHATIADILAEWARVGGTQMVTAGRIAGPPLTLDLRGVSELEALDVILRSAGGFVTVSRTAGIEAPQLSRFSRVVIVPSGTAGGPASAMPAPLPVTVYAPPVTVQPTVVMQNGAQRLVGPDGQLVPDDQEDAPPPPTPPAAVMPGGSMPPGFSEPSGAPSHKGVPRPGLIIPPPAPPRRPGGPISD